MRLIEETNQSLENIELLLKSIDYQLTKLVMAVTKQNEKSYDLKMDERPRLLTTKEASKMFGVSEYELRRGFKEGIYPAIQLGSEDNQFRKIKWRSDWLEETLHRKK